MGNFVSDYREARLSVRHPDAYDARLVECITDLLVRHDERIELEHRLAVNRRRVEVITDLLERHDHGIELEHRAEGRRPNRHRRPPDANPLDADRAGGGRANPLRRTDANGKTRAQEFIRHE